MSQGKYSAVDYKGWFSQERFERFEGQELVVGIDAAKIAFYASVMASGWDDFDILYFERDDIKALVGKLSRLGFEQITMVVEPTGTYADGLIDQARKAGITVVRINGDRVSKAAKVFDGVPSLHDGKAAYLLGRLYLCGVGDVWEETPADRRELRALTQMDELVEKSQRMLQGPLEAYLARHWPELTGVLDLTRATLLELIAHFGSAQKVAANPSKARALMREAGGRFLSDEKIEAVLLSAKDTIGVEPTALERQFLKFLAGTLRQAQRGGKKVRRQVEKAATKDEHTKDLVGFAGKRSAVFFVALLGSLTDYESPSQLEKGFGINLCDYSTGQTKEDKQRETKGLHISKHGPGKARSMLYFLALRLLNPNSHRYCEIACAWYAERLRRNGGYATKALVALMRKVVSALWWVARGHDYDAHKLFDVPRLKRLGHL